MMTLRTAVFVALGGALGSLLRYGVGVLWDRLGGGQAKSFDGPLLLPWPTLFVNIVGSFLLVGLVEWTLLKRPILDRELTLFLTTGLCGGFTTYSTFNFELIRFLSEEKWLRAGLYLGMTVGGALAAGGFALLLVRSVFASAPGTG